MNPEIRKYNDSQSEIDRKICDLLADQIVGYLPEAEGKVWHGHPVWFLAGNPVVGYSKPKGPVSLLFWSGQSFEEEALKPKGKFKAAGIDYADITNINKLDLERWMKKVRLIQWDYKNLVKRKGILELLNSQDKPEVNRPLN